MKMTKVQTGGKLYIAGEYAVLTPGQTAIIKNIPIHMTAVVKENSTIKLSSDMFDYSATMSEDKNYALIQASVQTLADYLGKSIDELASYTLLKLGDNGSMGDIACIAYDDLVAFTSFNRQKVAKWIVDEPIQTVLDKDWEYQIEVIKPALSCEFLVGWTKQPSISKDMINLVKSAISEEFLTETEQQVQTCKKALLSGDKEKIKSALQNVSDLLLSLSSAIYIDKLKDLKAAEEGLDVIAKSSGSGGGDCGIAISFDSNDTKVLITRWQNLGIELLDLEKLS